MASKAIDRTIDMLLRNLRTEVARLETELRLSKMEADGLRYQLQEKKRKETENVGKA
jgi:SMC interacting uncharacterized protein involved in chromosome segregation